MSTTAAADTSALDLAQIPSHIREDVGNTLFKSFMEAIKDPEKLRRYNELGEAFLKRRAEQKGGSQ